MTAIAVKVLVMEAIRKTVSSATVCATQGPQRLPVEDLQRSVADHTQGETDGRMAVEDRVDFGLHLHRTDVAICTWAMRDGRVPGAAPHGAERRGIPGAWGMSGWCSSVPAGLMIGCLFSEFDS